MSTESDNGLELTERGRSSSITVPVRAQKDTVLRRNVSGPQSVSRRNGAVGLVYMYVHIVMRSRMCLCLHSAVLRETP